MLHENWKAWKLFLQCATQWRRETVFSSHMKAPVMVTHGLDYGGVEAVMRLSGVRRADWKRLFRKIQWIESGALEGFSGSAQ